MNKPCFTDWCVFYRARASIHAVTSCYQFVPRLQCIFKTNFSLILHHVNTEDLYAEGKIKNSYCSEVFKRSNYVWQLKLKIHTVPIETPQSMFEDPSKGSNTTMYLQNQKEFVTSIK